MKPLILVLALALAPVASKLDPFPEHDTGFDWTVKTLLAAQMTAVAAMWVYMRNELRARDKQRELLWRRIAKLTGFARLIQSCNRFKCPFGDVDLSDEKDDDDEEET